MITEAPPWTCHRPLRVQDASPESSFRNTKKTEEKTPHPLTALGVLVRGVLIWSWGHPCMRSSARMRSSALLAFRSVALSERGTPRSPFRLVPETTVVSKTATAVVVTRAPSATLGTQVGSGTREGPGPIFATVRTAPSVSGARVEPGQMLVVVTTAPSVSGTRVHRFRSWGLGWGWAGLLGDGDASL